MGRIGPRRNRRSPRTLDAKLRSVTIFQSAGQVAGPVAGPMGPMADRTPNLQPAAIFHFLPMGEIHLSMPQTVMISI